MGSISRPLIVGNSHIPPAIITIPNIQVVDTLQLGTLDPSGLGLDTCPEEEPASFGRPPVKLGLEMMYF